MPATRTALKIATRRSPLAISQANEVAGALAELAESERLDQLPPCELLPVSTTGDYLEDTPLNKIGGEGVFVKEVQAAVLSGSADIAVHSAKDIPSVEVDGLIIGCVLERADPRDALVSDVDSIFDLPASALVATGSIRRRSQLSWIRPDLNFCQIRGNIHTRLNKIKSSADAGIIAMAAIERLEIDESNIHPIHTSMMLPQAGQGILAVECRSGDHEIRDYLSRINDETAYLELLAERAFLRTLSGGCNLPVGVLATASRANPLFPSARAEPARAEPAQISAQMNGILGAHSSAIIEMTGMIASRNGRALIRQSLIGMNPEELGAALAQDLLVKQGGDSLMNPNREY